jgi:hypothetical protein
MIVRHNRCRGLKLWKWGRTQIELWWCPALEKIETHTHEEFDGLIVYLAGKMVFWTPTKTRVIGWRDFLKTLKIPAGLPHGAIGRWPHGCLFLNFERWKNAPTSASTDFVLHG